MPSVYRLQALTYHADGIPTSGAVRKFTQSMYTGFWRPKGENDQTDGILVCFTCSTAHRNMTFNYVNTLVFGKAHTYINHLILTLWTPEAGISTAQYINATARSRYTGGTVLNAPGQKPVYRICFRILYVYAVDANRRPPSLFGKLCAILRPTWRMWKTLKGW